MKKWLSKYSDEVPNAQNGIEGTMGGLTDQGFNYNGAWGGTMQTGGSLPGSVGFMYARTQSPAPSNGPYAKKTKPSAQTGKKVNPVELPPVWVIGSKDKETEEFYSKFLDSLIRKRALGVGVEPDLANQIMDIPTFASDIMGEYQGYMTLGNKYGFPKVSPHKRSGIYSNASAHYDSLSETIYANDPEGWLSEMAHHVQTKDNKIEKAAQWFLKDLPQYVKWLSGNTTISPYHTPGTVEHEAHDIIEPKLKIEKKKVSKKYNELPVIKRELQDYTKGLWWNKNGGITSAQNGMEMKYWQEGLDWRPKTISENGSWLEKYQEGGPVTDMAPEVVITGKKPKSSKKLIEFTTQDINPWFETEEKEWLEKEARPAIYDQWQYMKDYVNSPAYKDRLKKLYNTEVKYRSDRAEEIIGEVKEDESPFLKFNDRAKKKWVNKNVKNTIKYANSELEGLRDKKINIRFGSYYPNMQEEAYYQPPTNYAKDRVGNIDIKASFLKNPDVGGLHGGPIHELSHSTTFGLAPYSDDITKDYISKIFDSPTNTEMGFYVQKPTETKARIDAIRYLAYKKGIYDPMSGDITDEQFEKLISDKDVTKDINYKQIQDQLKKEHKKGGLKWLLNNIAKLQPLEQQELPLAQSGTVIEDSLGQWAHPGQITKIPSNEITMQGVNYPVLGISDTGDVQMMQPGQDYTFDGNSVTEIPMMQKGGAVKDPGYSEPDYVTGTSRRAINKMIGMGNYLLPADVLNQAADFAKAKGLDYGANTSGPADAVRHAASAASTAARLPIPKLISEYSPALDRAMRIAATNALGLGYELRHFNLDGALMDLENNYKGSLIGSIPGLSDKERNKMIVNQLTNKQLTVDNPKRKKENGGWLTKYE